MPTLNPVIVPAKALKGGRHKIRISIAHNGETRYIVTDILIDSAKEFKNGAIVKRPDAAMLNAKLRGLLIKYQKDIDEMSYIEGLTCSELIYQLKTSKSGANCTLQAIYEEYLTYSRIKPSSAKLYAMVWRQISGHIKPTSLVKNVNHITVIGLDKYFRDRKLAPTTLRFYMSFFASLINYAKKCGYVQFRVDPFFGYKPPEPEVRQCWLEVDEIKRISDLNITDSNTALCRDLFMLSYYLGGINIVDLLDINFNKHRTSIKYVRTKTETRPKINKAVEFVMPEEALSIISRLKGPEGRIKVMRRKNSYQVTGFLTYYLPRIAKAANIDRVLYYSARKSFSQHAFNLGVSTSVIDYILGHRVDKGGSSLYAYISVTPQMATEAIRLVLDNLK